MNRKILIANLLILCITCIFCFSSCDKSNKVNEEMTTEKLNDRVEESSDVEEQSTEPKSELSESEYKPIDFKLPKNFKDMYNYVTNDKYDVTRIVSEEETDADEYYLNDKLVKVVTKDEQDRIKNQKFYDESELVDEVEYDYSENSAVYNHYIDGKLRSLKIFAFDKYGKLIGATYEELDADNMMTDIGAYEFNERGKVVNYMSNEEFQDFIFQAIQSELAPKLQEGIAEAIQGSLGDLIGGLVK